MDCSLEEFMQYIEEEDIKFIRLAFCDVHGNLKNISIMPHRLEEAISYGIPINASLIPGFGENIYPDLFLHPDISTTTLLPWRPESGKVIRKERYEGNLTRSFYVGENLDKEDIKAKYENGVLSLVIPKKAPKAETTEDHYIAIE